MKFITILITIITSCISLSAYESREELIAAYDKELDALVEKSLSFNGITMDDVYLAIPDEINNYLLKGFVWEIVQRFEAKINELVEARVESASSDEYKELIRDTQKEWREYVGAEASERYWGGGTGAVNRSNYTTIERQIERIKHLPQVFLNNLSNMSKFIIILLSILLSSSFLNAKRAIFSNGISFEIPKNFYNFSTMDGFWRNDPKDVPLGVEAIGLLEFLGEGYFKVEYSMMLMPTFELSENDPKFYPRNQRDAIEISSWNLGKFSKEIKKEFKNTLGENVDIIKINKLKKWKMNQYNTLRCDVHYYLNERKMLSHIVNIPYNNKIFSFCCFLSKG